jgi:hypothetical protein
LLICRSVHNVEGGDREIGETKTDKGKRKIVLPASTFYLLRERKRTDQSSRICWSRSGRLLQTEPTKS